MENQMEGAQNLKITLLYDPIISLLSIYLKEMESTSQRVVWIPKFIPKVEKQPMVHLWIDRKRRCTICEENTTQS